jgi:hypothetical protein
MGQATCLHRWQIKLTNSTIPLRPLKAQNGCNDGLLQEARRGLHGVVSFAPPAKINLSLRVGLDHEA